MGKGDNLSVGFKRKFDELKSLNPHKIDTKLYKEWKDLQDKEQAAFRAYMEYSNKLSEEFKIWNDRITKELSPLVRSIYDQHALLQIFD